MHFHVDRASLGQQDLLSNRWLQDMSYMRAVQGEVLRRSASELQEKDPKLSNEEATTLAKNLAAIERGMAEVRAGRGQPMKQALREIADGLGLELDR